MLTLNRKEERPQSKTITAVKDDIFEFEQHRGVRYVLDQLHSFFTTCELMDLPCDNPFSFFAKLNYLLHHPEKFTIDGKPDALKSYRLVIEGILMLYASYGNTIFEFASVADDTVFNHLWEQPSLPWIGEELDRFGLKKRVCELAERAERRDIYRIYRELLQFNEHNTYLSIRNGTIPLCRITFEKEMKGTFVSSLYHLFLSYYAAEHGQTCEISAEGTLSKEAQALMTYMNGLIALRELERKHMSITSVQQLSAAVKDLAKLSTLSPDLEMLKSDQSESEPEPCPSIFYKTKDCPVPRVPNLKSSTKLSIAINLLSANDLAV